MSEQHHTGPHIDTATSLAVEASLAHPVIKNLVSLYAASAPGRYDQAGHSFEVIDADERSVIVEIPEADGSLVRASLSRADGVLLEFIRDGDAVVSSVPFAELSEVGELETLSELLGY